MKNRFSEMADEVVRFRQILTTSGGKKWPFSAKNGAPHHLVGQNRVGGKGGGVVATHCTSSLPYYLTTLTTLKEKRGWNGYIGKDEKPPLGGEVVRIAA